MADKKTVEQIHGQLWDLMLKKIRSELNRGVTQTALAKRVGVRQPTINRWINREGGGGVEMQTVLSIIYELGVSMDEIAEAIGEDHLAQIVKFFLEDEDYAKKTAAVIAKADEADKNKIRAEIDYLYKRIS